MKFKRFLIISLALAFAGAASATPLVWTVSATLGDGTSVNGHFTFDADTDTFSALSLATSGGSIIPSENDWIFNTSNVSAEANISGDSGFQAVDASGNENGAHYISLYDLSGPDMTDAGGVLTLSFFNGGTCEASDCSFASGTVYSGSGTFTASASAPAPEPSPFILAGSSLLLFGAFHRRRDAKTRAAGNHTL